MTKSRLLRLEPDIAYLAADLFLPTSKINLDILRQMLTFGAGTDRETCLLQEHAHHVEVPRSAISPSDLQKLGIEVVDVRPRSFGRVSLRPKSSFILRPRQIPAVDALRNAAPRDAVLNLACGRGKTVLSWYEAAAAGGPVLFVAPQVAHLRNAFLELQQFFEWRGEPGWIAEGKFEWDREVVFATVQSLANRVRKGELPIEFHHHFATSIYDEAHHMSAAYFLLSANICQGRRIGLTAEQKRTDGMEGVFHAHLGQSVYSDTEPDLEPDVYFERLTEELTEEEEEEASDRNGDLHIGMLYRTLGQKEGRNAAIEARLRHDLKKGRVIYALSHSPDHVVEMHKRFPGSSIILEHMPGDERLRQLNSGQLVFTTTRIGSESYNRKDLDCVHLMTPPGALEDVAIVFNQCVGRALRKLNGKPKPIVRVYHDINIGMCSGLTWAVFRYCRNRGWPTYVEDRKRSRL